MSQKHVTRNECGRAIVGNIATELEVDKETARGNKCVGQVAAVQRTPKHNYDPVRSSR